MFKKKMKASELASKLPSLRPSKFPKPKVLLVDLPDSARTKLAGLGFNVLGGSFGRPYAIPKGDGYYPVVTSPTLPNYSEQEIVIIELCSLPVASQPEGEKHTSPGENDWWAKCNLGQIDPRPRAMVSVRTDADRIFANGGAFVVFADEKINQQIVFASKRHNSLEDSHDLPYDNWSFLSAIEHFDINSDQGSEVDFDRTDPLGALLSEYSENCRFTCTIDPGYPHHDNWVTIGTSKFGAAVAGYFIDPESKGCVLVLPQIRAKTQLLVKLLQDFLPSVSPHLFPHLEGAKWVHRSEYELPKIVALQDQTSDLTGEYQRKLQELQREIAEEKTNARPFYDLIAETGTPLVDAVKHTLEVLGFKKVVDVDATEKAAGNMSSLREDLQIHDRKPILIVDIKGVSGTSTDADALQAQKHTFIRIKEWNRTDVKGLTVINHQRHLPPLDRDNSNTFRTEILHNAHELDLGLMTCWDLWRLLRNYTKLGWSQENVQSLFYRTGRIEIIPEHYEYVGVIEHVWSSAVGIRVDVGGLCVGNTLAFEGMIEFTEQSVESMQLDGQDLQEANSGDGVGVETTFRRPTISEGMRVFRVRNNA